MNGFTATCVDCAYGYSIPDRTEVAKHISAVKERAKKWARKTLIDDFVNDRIDVHKRVEESANCSEKKDKLLKDMKRIVREGDEWLSTEAGRAAFVSRVSEIAAILKPITLELMLTKEIDLPQEKRVFGKGDDSGSEK